MKYPDVKRVGSMTKKTKTHTVHVTIAKKDGDMGRTTIREFKTKIGAQNYFNKVLIKRNLYGATLMYGKQELAQANGM